MSDHTAEIGDPVQVGKTLYRLRIDYDSDGYGDPREEYDYHLATLVLSHRRYDLPSEGDLTSEIGEAFARGGFRLAARYLRVVHGAVAVLPVYGYDHGQLHLQAMATPAGAFADPWDSGLAGLAYVTRARADEIGVVVDDPAKVAEWIIEEVDQYNTWATGGMTCWMVESYALAHGEDAEDVAEDDPAWSVVESCGAFYSVEEARESGTEDGLTPTIEEARQAHADATAEDRELALAEIGGVL